MEERCGTEIELLRQRLDREYEQLLFVFQKESTRIRTQQQSELEKKVDDHQFGQVFSLRRERTKRARKSPIASARRGQTKGRSWRKTP